MEIEPANAQMDGSGLSEKSNHGLVWRYGFYIPLDATHR